MKKILTLIFVFVLLVLPFNAFAEEEDAYADDYDYEFVEEYDDEDEDYYYDDEFDYEDEDDYTEDDVTTFSGDIDITDNEEEETEKKVSLTVPHVVLLSVGIFVAGGIIGAGFVILKNNKKEKEEIKETKSEEKPKVTKKSTKKSNK